MTSADFDLRPPVSSDLDALVAIHSDPATNQHNPSGPLRDPQEGRSMLDTWISDWRRHGIGYWAVVDSQQHSVTTGATVGFGGIRYLHTEAGPVLNLYYRFSPGHWGKGWATALACTAVSYAGEVNGDVPVIARMQPENLPSRRVAEKAGLTLTGQDKDARSVLSDRPLSQDVLLSLPAGPVRPGSST